LRSPLAGTELTARFGNDGTLSGSSGCNTYTAPYTTDKGAIEVTMPAATQKACAEPAGVMEQEAAYLALLPTAVKYRLDGRSLQLLSSDGTGLATYTRAAQP
jgi:heat shock protein HslJ